MPIDVAKELLARKKIPAEVGGAFHKAFSGAMEAADEGDWDLARQEISAASAIFPDSPDVIRLRLDLERAAKGRGVLRGQPSSREWAALASLMILAAVMASVSVLTRKRRLMPLAVAAAPAGPEVVISPGSRERFDGDGSRPRLDRSMMGRFTILNGERAGEKLGLGGSGIRIGRESSVCEIVLENPKISRLHAEVVSLDGKVLLIDRNSSNGTFVNDHKIDRHFLNDGDIIYFGGRSAVAVAFHL